MQTNKLLSEVEKVLLMGPGPSMVHDSVYKALSVNTLGHLDPYFIQIMDAVKVQLQEVFQTDKERLQPIRERSHSITLDLWKRPSDVFWEARDDVISWPMFQECMTSSTTSIEFAKELVDSLPASLTAEDKERRLRDIIKALGNVSRSDWGFERQAIATMSGWFTVVDESIRAEVISELSKSYLFCPGLVSEYIARCPAAEELFSEVERRSRVEETRAEAMRPGGGVLYFVFTNPWIREQWMDFLINDFATATTLTEAAKRAVERILYLVMSYQDTDEG